MTLIQKKEWAIFIATLSLSACSFGSGLDTGERTNSGKSGSSGSSSSTSGSGSTSTSGGGGSSASGGGGSGATSDGSASGGGSGSISGLLLTTTLTVEALFQAAPNWNDYVKLVDPATSCTGNEDTAADCLHGGESRLVRTEETTCTGLTLTDSLGVFTWTCAIVEGKARFTSSMDPDKGLADLLESTSWKSMSVTLQKGAQSLTSTSTPWWTNPVRALPDNSATSATPVVQDLTEVGTIYTLSSNRESAGYHIGADGVGLVVLAGATLKYDGILNNYVVDGSMNSNPSCTTFPCFQSVITLGNHKFAWVEGNIEGTSAALNTTLYANTAKFGRINKVHLSGTIQRIELNSPRSASITQITSSSDGNVSLAANSQSGSLLRSISLNAGIISIMGSAVRAEDLSAGHLVLSYANRNSVRNAKLSNSSGFPALRISNLSDDNFLENIIISKSGHYGVEITYGSDRNHLSKINVSNTQGFAMYVGGIPSAVPVTSTTVSEGLFVSNAEGIFAENTTDLHIIASTIALHGSGTFMGDGNSGTVFHDVAVVGNAGDGIQIWNSNNTTVSQLYIDSGDDWSITANGTTNGLKIAGTIAGPNPICGSFGSASNLNFSTTVSACTAFTPGEFNRLVGTASFNEKISASDPINSSDDSSLTPAGGDIVDWVEFENRFRAWGKSGALGSDTTTNHCTTAASCSIWDWSIRSDDVFLRDRSLSPGALNAKLTDGSRCPSTENANLTLTTQDGGTTYLRLAFEELGDSVGDDDGLCEADETCIYTPSIGVDQGYSQFEGATFETCSMPASPALAGITLKAYIAD